MRPIGTATLIARDEIGTLANSIDTDIATLIAHSTGAGANGGSIVVDEEDGIILEDVDNPEGRHRRHLRQYEHRPPQKADAVDAIDGST